MSDTSARDPGLPAADAVESEARRPDDGQKIGIRGDFIDRLSSVSDTSVSLLNCVGYTERDAPVLVPFVEVKLHGTETDDARRPMFAHTLTLDNLAVMLADLSTDFGSACHEMRCMAHDRLSIEPARLAYIVQTVRRMREQVDASLEDLATMPSVEPPGVD